MVFFRIGTLVFIRVNAAFFIIVTFKSSAVFYRLCLRCLTDKAGIGLYAVCLSGGLTGYSSRIPTMSDGGNSCPFGNTAITFPRLDTFLRAGWLRGYHPLAEAVGVWGTVFIKSHTNQAAVCRLTL